MSEIKIDPNAACRELPRYKSHKEVWALKIKDIVFQAADGHIIVLEDEGFAPFVVTDEYVHKHDPQAGGYYVQYKDGYKSYSPAEAFEDGYTSCDRAAAVAENYTANDDTFPTELVFSNGRRVGIAFDGDKPYLTCSWDKMAITKD